MQTVIFHSFIFWSYPVSKFPVHSLLISQAILKTIKLIVNNLINLTKKLTFVMFYLYFVPLCSVHTFSFNPKVS